MYIYIYILLYYINHIIIYILYIYIYYNIYNIHCLDSSPWNVEFCLPELHLRVPFAAQLGCGGTADGRDRPRV